MPLESVLRSRLLDLRYTPRCITGLSFRLHFAEPKIGSALVTRCCLPPRSLSLSVSRSSASSFPLDRIFWLGERSVRPQIHLRFLIPTYYESWSALFDARSFSDTVRCTFDPLYFWKIVTLSDLPATATTSSRRTKLMSWHRLSKAETPLVKHGNFNNSRHHHNPCSMSCIDCNKVYVHRRFVGMRSRSRIIYSSMRGYWFPWTSSSLSSSSSSSSPSSLRN